MKKLLQVVGIMSVIVIVLLASWSQVSYHAPTTLTLSPSIAQPMMKKQVYVFFDRFLDRGNSTTPSQILQKLNAVNAYFSNVTFGTWQFNWTTFYPSLGSPWWMANETYSQAGSSWNLKPLMGVIDAANRSGISYPPPQRYPLVPTALLFHAGNDGAMTGNSSDIWSVTTGPYCGNYNGKMNAYCLLVSVVAETDPVGVIAHELTHTLQRFNETGVAQGITLGHSAGALPTGTVPVGWWDLMYQGMRNDNGNHPSLMMAWTQMSIGFLSQSQIAVVNRTENKTVSLHDIEESGDGVRAIRIPITQTSTYKTYYFVELRKGIGNDAYFPWLTPLFPNKMGLLVYIVNVTLYGWQMDLMKARPGDINAQQALFGPASGPFYPGVFQMNDATNHLNVTILQTGSSVWSVNVKNDAVARYVCYPVYP